MEAENNPYKCPKCSNLKTLSVMAMSYKETSFTHGYVSGSGVGIGTGGLGIMAGGGSVNLTNETKRASTFKEPEKKGISYLLLLVPVIAIGGIMFSINAVEFLNSDPLNRTLPDSSSDSSPGKGLIAIANNMRSFISGPVISGILITGLILAIIMMPRRQRKLEAETDEFNRTVIKPLEDRYAEIRYCENCATLFDQSGHAVLGNEEGFNYLMSLPAKKQEDSLLKLEGCQP